MTKCCICQRDLPNKYAIAGKCLEDSCNHVFCSLHWRAGNQRCTEHGWRGGMPRQLDDFQKISSNEVEKNQIMKAEEMTMSTPEQNQTNESRIREWARTHLTVEQAKKVMQTTVDFATRTGRAASALVARLRNEKSPDDMLKAIDESLAANKEKSRPLAERAELLYKNIAQRKKVYESAPPARKKLLELELRNMMAEYKGAERELTAFYDNEHSLNVVRGRLLELMAHGMRRLDESVIDKLVDDIEDVVTDAEGVRDAVRDLDKSGKRRERESDQEAFADALAGFEDFSDGGIPESGAAATEAAPLVTPPSEYKPVDVDEKPLAELEDK